jgi:hypothetical protein
VTLFHGIVFAFLAFLLLALFLVRRPSTPKPERDDRTQCNVCGERFDDDDVVEREFISGYTYFLCRSCIEAMRNELLARSKRA